MDKLIWNYDFRLLKVSLPYLKTSDAHHYRDAIPRETFQVKNTHSYLKT
jgi:hypothetical protein